MRDRNPERATIVFNVAAILYESPHLSSHHFNYGSFGYLRRHLGPAERHTDRPHLFECKFHRLADGLSFDRSDCPRPFDAPDRLSAVASITYCVGKDVA